MSDEFRIGVVGAGATGGYLAGRLTHAGIPVTLFARGRSLEAIQKNGIRIDGPDDYSVVASPEHVVSAADEMEAVDLALFCVKSFNTEQVAATIEPLVGDDGYILCLQNGVENEHILAEHFGAERILAGTLYIGVERTAPGVIACSFPPRIIFGPYAEYQEAPLDKVKEVFDKADIDCAIDTEILTVKWQKFLFNCALNPLTALTREKLGPLLKTEEGLALFESLVNEAIAVGKASGAPLRKDAHERVMETARQMNISSSMAEDLDQGRPIELDAFSGYIRQLGQQTGIPTPTTDAIYYLLAILNPGRKVYA